MFLVSLLLYIFISFYICDFIFRSFSLPKFLIALFIGMFSANILIFEILNIFNQIGNQFFFLILQTLILGLFFLSIRGKKTFRELVSVKSDLLQEKMNWLDYLFLALFFIDLGVLFYVGINTPPSNNDSLHTHLLRIFYWLQHGSFSNWPATGLEQIYYPINANIQGMWLFLLTGNENTFFLVPWFSLVIVCCSIYELTRLLRFSKSQALLSCLIFSTYPIVILQVYSFQNDLVVTALISVCIFLIYSYKRNKNKNEFIAFFLILAIALGVKKTAFVVLPIIGMLLLLFLIFRKIVKSHLAYTALFFLFFLVFSSFRYFQNLTDYRSFFGPDTSVMSSAVTAYPTQPTVSNNQPGNLQTDLISTTSSTSVLLSASKSYFYQDILQKFKYNIPRYLYNLIDFEGMGGNLSTKLTEIKAKIIGSSLSRLGLNLEDEAFLAPGHGPDEQFQYLHQPIQSEDTSWFGPLAVLLITISAIIVLFQKDKERKEYLLFASLYFLSYLFLVAYQRPGWDPYQGRYFILGIMPLTILTGRILPDRGVIKFILQALLLVSMIAISFNTLATNTSKPLLTARTFLNFQNNYVLKLPNQTKLQKYIKTQLIKQTNTFSKEYPQKASILAVDYYHQLFYSSSFIVKDIEMIESVIPATSPTYILITRDPLEYGLFGRNRTREVFPITNIDQVNLHSFLIIENNLITNMKGFRFVISNNRYSLYIRDGQ